MCYLIACCSVLDREFNSAQIYSMEVILGEVDLYFVQLIWAGVVWGGAIWARGDPSSFERSEL
jgi:hypothetical protein